jgi:hypothetical protein
MRKTSALMMPKKQLGIHEQDNVVWLVVSPPLKNISQLG